MVSEQQLAAAYVDYIYKFYGVIVILSSCLSFAVNIFLREIVAIMNLVRWLSFDNIFRGFFSLHC